MKTSDLIGMLATGAGPAPRAAVARRLVPVVSGGAALAAMLAIAAPGLVPAEMFSGTALWTKLAYAALLASASGWLTARLSRPAAPTTLPWCTVAAIVGAMAVLGIVSLLAVPAGGRVSHLLGLSWSVCPWFVLALSLPTLVGALWAVRGLAPTRPHQTGLAAGLLAGAVGALGYSWACPEASMTFVAVWYSLGIALTGLIGMALGPHVLRW